MQIAMSKTREQFPLSTKKIIKKTITDTMGWIFISFFITGSIIGVMTELKQQDSQHIAFGQVLPLATMIVLFSSLIIAFLNYLYQRWYFATYFYDLTNDYVVIRKSPITPREITIPFERIQDVYVDQDILDRIMGLYDVHLSSATVSSGMEAHIDGVEKQAADGLRSALLNIIHERISKKKV